MQAAMVDTVENSLQISVENTDFDFRHRVFSLPGICFRLAPDGSGPVMHLDLDGSRATVEAKVICESFDVAAGSRDAELIALLPRALKYRREIRPGESIPTEILDGRASWLAEEKYLAIANAKLTVQIVAWMKGEQIELIAPEQALESANDDATKQRVQEAFGTIADKLGYAGHQRGEVVTLVDRLAGELSYIEALRERLLGRIRRMMNSLRSLQASYRRQKPILENIERINQLLAKPVRQISDLFDEIDANMGEILPALRNFNSRVDYIRKTRDKLREMLLQWEDLLDWWPDLDGEASPSAERAVRDAYRFAARHFPQGSQWSLSMR